MPKPSVSIGRDQLRVLSNPARLAIHTSLRTDGPATAKELALRLGRDEMSLYYHLRLMSQYGLLQADTRPTATKPESVYSAPGPLRVELDLDDPKNLDEVGRNVDSLMKAASKEYKAAAVQLGNAVFDQGQIARMAVRLSDEKAKELRRRLREVSDWLSASGSDVGQRYSFTYVVAPLVKKESIDP